MQPGIFRVEAKGSMTGGTEGYFGHILRKKYYNTCIGKTIGICQKFLIERKTSVCFWSRMDSFRSKGFVAFFRATESFRAYRTGRDTWSRGEIHGEIHGVSYHLRINNYLCL